VTETTNFPVPPIDHDDNSGETDLYVEKLSEIIVKDGTKLARQM